MQLKVSVFSHYRLLWKFLNITDRSCNNQLVTTELVVQCRKYQWLTELREWKTYKNMKWTLRSQKCAKVRALFADNKVRFPRAEQLCIHVSVTSYIRRQCEGGLKDSETDRQTERQRYADFRRQYHSNDKRLRQHANISYVLLLTCFGRRTWGIICPDFVSSVVCKVTDVSHEPNTLAFPPL